MDTVSASEFKSRCLALLDQVARTGRPLAITRHGTVVAKLVPPHVSDERASGWVAAWERG